MRAVEVQEEEKASQVDCDTLLLLFLLPLLRNNDVGGRTVDVESIFFLGSHEIKRPPGRDSIVCV